MARGHPLRQEVSSRVAEHGEIAACKLTDGAGTVVNDLPRLRARRVNVACLFQFAHRLLQRRILGNQLQGKSYPRVLRGASLLD